MSQAPLTDWVEVLEALLAGESLNAPTTQWVMAEMLTGGAPAANTAAFLVALRAKGETAAEVSGLVAGMMGASVPLEVQLGDATLLRREVAVGPWETASESVRVRVREPGTLEGVARIPEDRLASDDRRWPFSFLNVCRVLRLDPDDVRARVAGIPHRLAA